MISDLDTEPYKDCYVYIYCSVDAIVPLWAYFLLGDKLMSSAKKVVYGSQKELELLFSMMRFSNMIFPKCRTKEFW
jgi:hypothetical protein